MQHRTPPQADWPGSANVSDARIAPTGPPGSPTLMRLAGQVESPSLGARRAGEPRAYELKFLLSEVQAREVESQLSPRLTLDIHADPALGNAYRVASVYCDTPQYDVFRQVGRHRFRKYRLRRYGEESRLFLERKTKRGDQVRKRRTTIADAELSLLESLTAGSGWEGSWFGRQIARQGLRPVCQVTYRRVAYFGWSDSGPLRLTFDREICGGVADGWSFCSLQNEPLLSDQVVCEFKFRGTLPADFKGVIQKLQLAPRGVSKYRLCVAASGVAKGNNHRA